jgi:hypothetical protein
MGHAMVFFYFHSKIIAVTMNQHHFLKSATSCALRRGDARQRGISIQRR